MSTREEMPISSIVRRSASRICAEFRTRIQDTKDITLWYALAYGSHRERQRPRVRSGARLDFRVRPRVPLRRGRVRDAPDLQRPAVSVRAAHAPAAQLGG